MPKNSPNPHRFYYYLYLPIFEEMMKVREEALKTLLKDSLKRSATNLYGAEQAETFEILAGRDFEKFHILHTLEGEKDDQQRHVQH